VVLTERTIEIVDEIFSFSRDQIVVETKLTTTIFVCKPHQTALEDCDHILHFVAEDFATGMGVLMRKC
jgi:hypothetical protein